MSYEDTQSQKVFYLTQLKRLEAKGHMPSRRFGMEHSLQEIKGEVLRIKKEISMERSVGYCKHGLVFAAMTIEMLNNRFDPFGIELDGWTKVIMSQKDEYEEVFEELYEKYSDTISAGP
jgi:hypothetical protein